MPKSTKNPVKPALKSRLDKSIALPLRANKKFSGRSAVTVMVLLVVVGLVVVALTYAGTKPYSRLDCTQSKHYMGVAGISASPPISGYVTRPGSTTTIPSRQACLDKSSEAMVAKIYKVVYGSSISANIPFYKYNADNYIGYRSSPAIEYTNWLLARSGANNFKKLSTEAKVTRLYTAALNRQPDSVGKDYWTKYLRKYGSAKTIASFIGTLEAYKKLQPLSNAALAVLPANYRPEASACGNGLNAQECAAYVRAVQNSQGVPCKAFTRGGSVVPKCAVGSKGGIRDVVVERNIDGSNVTLNKALAPKFRDMRQAAKREAGIVVAANDEFGPGYGSFRTSAMQLKLIQSGYPAARLDTSMHQWGLAVDLSCNGVKFNDSSPTCQNWIRSNSGRFGFKNLPSESWHYSSNGL